MFQRHALFQIAVRESTEVRAAHRFPFDSGVAQALTNRNQSTDTPTHSGRTPTASRGLRRAAGMSRRAWSETNVSVTQVGGEGQADDPLLGG